MYGTVARLTVKPGQVDDMNKWAKDMGVNSIPGLVTQYVFQQDKDQNELFLVAIFESKEAYNANATSPEQHDRYLKYRSFLAAEPEWHDGTVVYP